MYSRELDGQILTLAPSGWTYRRTFVLYDYETETLWYPLPGTEGLTGIAGPLRGRVLPALEAQRTLWGVWQTGHPQTGFMDYSGAVRNLGRRP